MERGHDSWEAEGPSPARAGPQAARRPLTITPQREGAGRRRDEEQQEGGSGAHGWSGAGGGEDGRQRQRAGKKNSNTPDKVTQPQLLPRDRSNTAKAKVSPRICRGFGAGTQD